MHPFLTQHIAQIEELCQKYQVERLYTFGSLVNGKFDQHNSDADFIVAFAPFDHRTLGQNYLNLLVDLSQLLGRPVDLLLDEPSENPYFEEELTETKQLIYEQASEKVFV